MTGRPPGRSRGRGRGRGSDDLVDRSRGGGRGGDGAAQSPGSSSSFQSGRGSGRGQERGDRGQERGSRGQERGGRAGFGRGRGGPVEVEVFSGSAGITPSPNTEAQKTENEIEKRIREGASGAAQSPIDRRFPLRPGYGTLGKAVTLWTNYFELVAEVDLLLFRYSIEITPQGKARAPVGKRIRRIVELLLEEAFSAYRNSIVTDYKSNIISRSELPIEAEGYHIKYRAEEEDEPLPDAAAYQIKLQNTGTLRVSELIDYLTSTHASALFDSKEEFIQALNIVVGNFPKTDSSIFSVGANRHFDIAPPNSEKMSLGAGLQAIRGFFVSVRAATSRLLVNVQVKHIACYEEGPLTRLVIAYLEQNSGNMFKLDVFLKKVRVKVTHIIKKNRNGQEIPRIKAITGLATPGDGQGLPQRPVVPKFAAGANEVKFFLAKKGSPSPGGSFITVSEFFKRTYNITVKDLKLPVINVGSRQNPSYLPLDVCVVVPGQPSGVKLSPNQTQQMIRFAVRKPAQNAQSIVTSGARILGVQSSINPTLNEFNIGLTPQLVAVPGRVLTVPEVKYRSNKSAKPASGSWNMQAIQFSTKVTLSSWTYLLISTERFRDPWSSEEELKTTMNAFQSKLRVLGMEVADYSTGLRIVLTGSNFDAQIDTAIGKFVRHPSRPPPKLLLVIMPFVDGPIYNRVKFICDVKAGLLNVCTIGTKFAKERNDQYFANLALKFNLKLGGRNQTLDNSKLGIIGDGTTMVVGMDVTHPSPGSKSNAPSVAGIVASIDQFLGQWPADLRIQPPRQEMVSGLDELLTSRLRLWAKHNKGLFPDKILIYRDGVSEGQYDIVLEQELPLLREACQKIYPASDTKKGIPRMSIIIVGKRHNTRFYATKKEDADRSSNPQNGTVVDRGITEARNWDFFLQAHTAIQGTARPAHYYIVLDEIFYDVKAKAPFQNAADVFEDLTHNMCYLFGRATKAVSICPPAYYADLVCERARCYLSHLFDATPGQTPSGSVAGGQGSVTEPDPNDVRIHENVRDSMFYI